jgi:tripartite ATP-independent transporter DctP family solute receptor
MRPPLFVLSLVTALLVAAAAATAGEIRLASLARPGTAQYTLAWKFKELVEARSAGRLMVTVDPAGTPARESEVLDQLRSGGLDIAIIAAGSLEGLVPTTRVLSFPFLFLTGEEADRVLDGAQGAALLRDVETIGCKGLGFTEGGFRHLTNSIRPVRTANDVRGLKVRVTGSPVQTAFWSALGARPTPGPWPIYADLEAGVLDGQDNTLRVIEAFGFDEVQPYLSLTRHAYVAYLNLASLHWWSLLSPGDQQLVQAAMSEAARLQRQDQRVRDAARVPVLLGRGMQVEEHPDLASFRALSAGLREHIYFRDPRVQTLLARMQEAVAMPAPAAVTEPAEPAVTAPAVVDEAPDGTGTLSLPMTAPALDQAAPGPVTDEPPAAPAPVEPDLPATPDTPPAVDLLPVTPPAPAAAPSAPQAPAPVAPDPPADAVVPQAPAPAQAPERIVHPGRDSEGGEAPIIEERIPPSPAPAPPPALTPSPGYPAAPPEPPTAPAVPDATGTGSPLQQP